VIYRVLLGPFVLDFGVACLYTMGEIGRCCPIVQFDGDAVRTCREVYGDGTISMQTRTVRAHRTVLVDPDDEKEKTQSSFYFLFAAGREPKFETS
jgi:hypothetical protein